MKKFFQTKLFYFLLGIFACGAVGVYAQTYFPSNQTTYDNSESGLTSTNVQGAIDELYSTCQNPPSASESLIDKVVTSGDGLYQDAYESGRYIFKGANPNNYITFNGEMAGWRIISVEADGTIKIVHIENVTYMAWDTSTWPYWDRASLNTYLNGTYYNSLTTTAQNKMVSNYYSVGDITDSYNLQYQITQENNTKWYGKIGLVSASEYIRANTNASQCGTFDLNYSNYSTCRNTNWLFRSDASWWLITPDEERSGADGKAFQVANNGRILSEVADYTYNQFASGVRPVVYLNPSITLKGKGSQQDPYTIE